MLITIVHNGQIVTAALNTISSYNEINLTQISTLCFGAAMGSEKAKNGRARLMKPFLNISNVV